MAREKGMQINPTYWRYNFNSILPTSHKKHKVSTGEPHHAKTMMKKSAAPPLQTQPSGTPGESGEETKLNLV